MIHVVLLHKDPFLVYLHIEILSIIFQVSVNAIVMDELRKIIEESEVRNVQLRTLTILYTTHTNK